MNRPVILAAGTPQVLLPYDNANRFVRELPQHTRPARHLDRVGRAEDAASPAEAAKLVGMSEAELREVNRIPPRMLVKAGSTLLVPRARRAARRRLRAHRRQRDAHARARGAAAAQGASAARRQEATASPRSPSATASARAGRAVERRRRRRASFAPGQTIVVCVAGKAQRGTRAACAPEAAGARPAPQSAPPAARVAKPRRVANKPQAEPAQRAARARSAWAIVPRSTYSSSLPTGTPRASRVTFDAARAAAPRRARAPWPRPRR